MKPRISSIVVGIGYLAAAVYVGLAVSKFKEIYAELLTPGTPLPELTRTVLRLAPAGWIAFGLLAAVFLIGKDVTPLTRKLPNWPFVILLLGLVAGAATALFLPLMITITQSPGV